MKTEMHLCQNDRRHQAPRVTAYIMFELSRALVHGLVRQ